MECPPSSGWGLLRWPVRSGWRRERARRHDRVLFIRGGLRLASRIGNAASRSLGCRWGSGRLLIVLRLTCRALLLPRGVIEGADGPRPAGEGLLLVALYRLRLRDQVAPHPETDLAVVGAPGLQLERFLGRSSTACPGGCRKDFGAGGAAASQLDLAGGNLACEKAAARRRPRARQSAPARSSASVWLSSPSGRDRPIFSAFRADPAPFHQAYAGRY